MDVRNRRLVWSVGTALLALGVPAVAVQSPPPTGGSAGALQQFESRIRPLLAARCFGCHAGSQPPQGGLRLDSRAALLKGGTRGPAVDLNQPEKSLLLRTVQGAAGVPRMPPDGKISSLEVKLLTDWVAARAPWPEVAAASGSRPDPRRHWAWKAPTLPAAPALTGALGKQWPRGEIDRFVLAELQRRKLAPNPPADKRTLLRRVTFDLTGLPPTPEEIREFESDPRPDAYERVVERLLASPAYGERWGRHWLDVARYGDSNGLDENLVFLHAWRYRDYVIRALNEDRPIDQFIQEQVAGDLLPPTGQEQRDQDRLVATGFLTVGPKMLAEDDPVKQEEDVIDEQIDTLGKAFLGLTLGCSRCHDHKFDPFPQTDYYALAGIFKSTRTMKAYKVVAEWQELPLVSREIRERLEVIDRQIQEKKKTRVGLVDQEVGRLLAEARNREPEYRELAAQIVREKRSLPAAHADRSLPPGSVAREAESFDSGNVLKDHNGYGQGIGVLVNQGTYPNLAEYDVELTQGGLWQLDIRFASGDPRPIRVRWDGQLLAANAAGAVTGGFYPPHQRWDPVGVFRLEAGKHRLRLERESYFPHIDRWVLTPFTGDPSSLPVQPEEAARERRLSPALLLQAIRQVRDNGPTAAVAFERSNELKQTVEAEDDTLRRRLVVLDREVAELEKSRPEAPLAMVVADGTPTTQKVHLRGSYLSLGEECARGVPAILQGSTPVTVPADRSGRLELARWLTAPENPLTARVFVNRVWRWHFGKGLVGSTDNFGTLGEMPSHPALLDWLAVTFRQQGWSLKQLHRQILLSSTYRMSSASRPEAAAVDPDNRWLWRQNKRRLEAEALRDSILAVSGRLDRTLGGSLLNFKPRQYVTSTANRDPVDYRSRRRSVYLPVIRSALFDFFTAFDFGDPTVPNGDRPTTTIAPQALFLMNGSVVLEESKALAERLLKEVDQVEPRIDRAFQLALGRAPSPTERSRAQALLMAVGSSPAVAGESESGRQLRAWQSLCKGLFALSEFSYVD